MKRFALSLNVGAVRPSIGEAFANDAFGQFVRAVSIIHAKRNAIVVRWSWFPGQFGGKAKMDSGFDYAASFSSFSCIA